ncbi:hypothetical protein V8D89_000995 [Ganoderma adspersum]
MATKFLLALLATWCVILQLQSFVPLAFASSHVVSQRQSEFVDVLWSGLLTEPYLTARVSHPSNVNSHALCYAPSGALSIVFSSGPSGATYGLARLNVSYSSAAEAASGEQPSTLSARHQRAARAAAKGMGTGIVKLSVVLTDAETAKRTSGVKSPLLFTSAEYGRACL